MKEITILLSACGSPSMPGMIACFRNNGERRIRIIGMDMSEEPSNRYLVDAFYTVPAATDPVYCDWVLDICKKGRCTNLFSQYIRGSECNCKTTGRI